MKKQMLLEVCDQLASTIQCQNTHRRTARLVQNWVAIVIWKLATPDWSTANHFGVGQSTVRLIVAEACEATRIVSKDGGYVTGSTNPALGHCGPLRPCALAPSGGRDR